MMRPWPEPAGEHYGRCEPGTAKSMGSAQSEFGRCLPSLVGAELFPQAASWPGETFHLQSWVQKGEVRDKESKQ